MEIKIDNSSNHTNNDDNDDALSLRAFQLNDQTATSSTRSSPRTSSAQDLFEFFPNPPNPSAAGDIVFCGKVISESVDNYDNDKLYDDNRLLNRDCVGGSSVRLHDRKIEHAIPIRSVSVPDLHSRHNGVKFSTSVKKVNVVNSKLKRSMFMCGQVNSMLEMEMSSIRERQLRRPPSRMFSVSENGDVVNSGKIITTLDMKLSVAGAGAGRHKNRLSSVIVRSLACLRI